MKHFQISAGPKRGLKNKNIAISLLVTCTERTVVLYVWIVFICSLDGSTSFCLESQGTVFGLALSDPFQMLIT